LALVAGNYPPEMVKETMHTNMSNRNLRETLTGKIIKINGQLFSNIWNYRYCNRINPDDAVMKSDISNVGAGLATAFVATFYGALLSNLFFHPMAEKLESRRIKNMANMQLIVTATLLVQGKHHPVYIEANLNSFMPPKERYARFSKRRICRLSQNKIPEKVA